MSEKTVFEKRMEKLNSSGSAGNYLVDRTKIQENKFFKNDPNYQKGFIYDWNMVPIEEVEFKFEKIKTYHAEGSEVEYWIRFRPDYNPENQFKSLYHRSDKKERFGFYIDVEDRSKGLVEKWIVMGKDNRVAFDRYSVFRCNWIFEWVEGKELKSCLGCIRNAADGSFSTGGSDKLGGSTVDSDMSFIVPSSADAQNLHLGQKFIISDNLKNPKTFKITDITDTAALGITKAYLKQVVHNPHTDYFGNVNEETEVEFVFPTPIDDLPEGFGGSYHAICDCIEKRLEPDETISEGIYLECSDTSMRIKGYPVTVNILNKPVGGIRWRYILDGHDVLRGDLIDLFDIEEASEFVTIRAMSQTLFNYVLKVYAELDGPVFIDAIELEIK